MRAVVGASGGAMIIAGTTEVFLNHFAREMDPFASVMAPRYYHQVLTTQLTFFPNHSVTYRFIMYHIAYLMT